MTAPIPPTDASDALGERATLFSDLVEEIANRLGEDPRSRNVFDHCDEATTVITMVDWPVDDLARFIAEDLVGGLATHDARIRREGEARVVEAVRALADRWDWADGNGLETAVQSIRLEVAVKALRALLDDDTTSTDDEEQE